MRFMFAIRVELYEKPFHTLISMGTYWENVIVIIMEHDPYIVSMKP